LPSAAASIFDGSKFKAVNAKAKSFTREKLCRWLAELDAAIERYMARSAVLGGGSTRTS
jgi:hypothetical protein